MTKKITARDPKELGPILDRIHDRWFDITQIRFEEAAKTVAIPFIGDDLTLIIHHVTELTVEDSQQIAIYDFDKFSYDSDSGRLNILTGIPAKITISVRRLEVDLDHR